MKSNRIQTTKQARQVTQEVVRRVETEAPLLLTSRFPAPQGAPLYFRFKDRWVSNEDLAALDHVRASQQAVIDRLTGDSTPELQRQLADAKHGMALLNELSDAAAAQLEVQPRALTWFADVMDETTKWADQRSVPIRHVTDDSGERFEIH